METAAPAALQGGEVVAGVLRLLQLFRWLAALVLGSLWALGGPYHLVGAALPEAFIGIVGLWLAFSLLLTLFPPPPQHSPHRLAALSVAVDGLALTLLTATSGGVESGLALLALVPLGGLCLLLPLRPALLTAAIAFLLLVAQQVVVMAADATEGAGVFAQTGYFGAIYFLVAGSAAFLGRQLRETRELVERQELDLANLAELSGYIVQHLREALLVVDADGRIRLANTAAAALLGPRAVPGQRLEEASRALATALQRWRNAMPSGLHGTTASFLSVDGGHELEPHFAPIGRQHPGPVLVFLEDLSRLAAGVQQAKLAALGRLSASIAHEIRTPVGAMSHAAQLLAESPTLAEEDRRLTEIMRTHGQRVSRLVTSVQQLSRRESVIPERIDLGVWLPPFLEELAVTLEWPTSRMQARALASLEVRVDPTHLRQILWNLGENAIQAQRAADSEGLVEWVGGRLPGGRPFLEIADRGSGVPEEVAEHLFEPFVSRRAGGTGLGLFIARELAVCNGASLRHEKRAGGGTVFRVVFADPQRWEA